MLAPIIALAVTTFLATIHTAQAGPGRIVTGAETTPHVKAFTTRTHTNVASFFAFTPSFSGGVRVASGDLNGDGAPDIIVGSGTGATHVKVFSGRDQSELRSFLPYGGQFLGGVFVAAGDVNGDGRDDVITGTDSGAMGHVKVFDGQTGSEIRSFFAYSTGYTNGVRVAAGDVNGDGFADIVTGAGAGAGPHVKVFDGRTGAELRSFFSYGPSFTGGIYVAAGDINGDGFADIVTGAGPGAGPHVKVFDGKTGAEIRSFFAYTAGFNGGVRVAAGDVNGDGLAELHTAPGNGSTPQVRVFDGATLAEVASFLAYSATYTNGLFIGASSAKGPRLEIRASKENDVQLQWPSGCLCELETTTDVTASRSWSVLDVTPVENGNRLIMLLPAVQKYQYFRLNCDDELTR